MATIQYRAHAFKAETRAIIDQANVIINDWEAQGFDMTMRQLYYQFIGQDVFPESWIDRAYNLRNGLHPDTKNTLKNYKRLCSIVDDGRYAGLVDWSAIVDRTRNLVGLSHWDSPENLMEAVSEQYRTDKWRDQDIRPEVWIEKDAAIGVVVAVCQELDVPYFSCRGYTSSSEVWAAGMRLRYHINRGYTPVIIHIGDHDPSGIDMTRDIEERLSLFTGTDIELTRVALNMPQVEEHELPPNPAKLTDSRCPAYVEEFGEDSWELDALHPSILVDLIRDGIIAQRDDELWAEHEAVEERVRSMLARIGGHWEDVCTFMDDNHPEV